ncbi:protein translocase subunit secE/sec61 gamma [Rhodothalassium salexigens DSM 2132]|uniref:Protein translocase subunit SecE n=1 Tax=Rhodothalassium salexigens DSM 2132 TaxID=1188247 RepID=A0A4R2PA79_RHOSA|nr:preprotein translocase subunit SecE [Rhodothalassium salexigens]MBB4212406.1 preprotein translocase subunit SecE [Rhodothalassium salexigens DSM 2132]MBK1637829.1 preprotein translocase subunit SecE [Rhodothalassium salexigens DSM 2132]TCP31963.1 protein translocase subunit secE/sec61 gamma [Rhodothalassium salexigens DSM 2132]
MARTSPAEFVRQVRQEMNKVTWPTRKEATVSTIMVLIMVFVMMLFFLGIDSVFSWAIQYILGLGN